MLKYLFGCFVRLDWGGPYFEMRPFVEIAPLSVTNVLKMVSTPAWSALLGSECHNSFVECSLSSGVFAAGNSLFRLCVHTCCSVCACVCTWGGGGFARMQVKVQYDRNKNRELPTVASMPF